MAQPALSHSSVGAPPLAVPEEVRPFLQALLNAPGWAVGFLDRDLRLQWANDTLAGMAGQALSSQLGRSLSELLPGLAPALAGEAIQGAAVSVAPERTSNGEARHLRISLLPAVSGGMLAGLTLLLQ